MDEKSEPAAGIDLPRDVRRRLLAGRVAVVDEIAGLLFDLDPVELNYGHNTDEYEPEAETIALRLPSASSAHDVERIVHEELVRWFDASEVGPEARYSAIANEIWERWQQFTAIGGGNE